MATCHSPGAGHGKSLFFPLPALSEPSPNRNAFLTDPTFLNPFSEIQGPLPPEAHRGLGWAER